MSQTLESARADQPAAASSTPTHASAPSRTQADEKSRRAPSLGTVIAVGAFIDLVVALQQTLVVPAVPRLPGLLGTTPQAVSWVVTATLVTGAVATPVLGRLSDLRGKRSMMLIAMAFVLVGSVIAPLGGIVLLTLGRALQGIGSALVPLAMAQMRDLLPRERLGSALALLSATLGVGGGIGVPLGGTMLQLWGWQSMFVLSALLAAVSLVLIRLVFPPDHADDAGRFDLVGAVLLSLGLVAVLVVISQATRWGWGAPQTWLGLLAGLVVLGGWAWYEIRQSSPLVDLRVSAEGALLHTNLASFVMGMAMFTNLLLTTLVLQGPASERGFGWSSSAAGLAMLPNALAMLAVAPVTARIAARWSARTLLEIGGAVTVVGYLGALLLSPAAALVIVWTTVIGIGVGIAYAALPMLVAQHAPLSEMGSANGVNALVRAVGTALASSLVATIAARWAANVGPRPVASAHALDVIAVMGAVLGAVTILFGYLARERVSSR